MTTAEVRDVMQTGWRVVSVESDDASGDVYDGCGITTHDGVLHPDEYVNMGLLVPALEVELGFSMGEVRRSYRPGRLKGEAQRELRARIDARLLELVNTLTHEERICLERVLGIDRRRFSKALTRATRARTRVDVAPDVEDGPRRQLTHVGPRRQLTHVGPRRQLTHAERMRRRIKNRRGTIRQALAARDGAFCRYCGHRPAKVRALTIDHVVSLASGGSNALENLVLACPPCNSAKGAELWPVPALAVAA